MTNIENLKAILKTINMNPTAENIKDYIEKDRSGSLTCVKFLESILQEEINVRENKKLE